MDTYIEKIREQLFLALQVIQDKNLLSGELPITSLEETYRQEEISNIVFIQGIASFDSKYRIWYSVKIKSDLCIVARIEFDNYLLIITLTEEEPLEYMIDLHRKYKNDTSSLIETLFYNMKEVLLKAKVGINSNTVAKNSNIF